MAPRMAGRLCRGSTLATMVIMPVKRPAEPMPAMARPTINMSDEVAAPLKAEPISKIRKKTRKDHRMSK